MTASSTPDSAAAIYHSPRARCSERFDAWPISKTGLNRRLNRALEEADELSVDDCRPNGLRATAASHHAGVGVEGTTLKALFGWSQLATASHYVETSSERAHRALLARHSR